MRVFDKKRIWTKVIKSDSNDSIYNQELIHAFYKKVYRSRGNILSLQVIPDIYSEKISPPEGVDDVGTETFISSYPIFYINYLSRKEVNFSEDNFRNFYDRNLEGKINNIKAESLGKLTEN